MFLILVRQPQDSIIQGYQMGIFSFPKSVVSSGPTAKLSHFQDFIRKVSWSLETPIMMQKSGNPGHCSVFEYR